MRVDQPVDPFYLSGKDCLVEKTHHSAARPVDQDYILYTFDEQINLAWTAVEGYQRLAAALIPPKSGQFAMELQE